MPSLTHQILLMLFQNRPSLAPELLVETLGQAVPEYDSVELPDADLSQLAPTEYRAVQVVLLRARTGEPVLGIVLEVQLRRDEAKPYSWPLYLAALRARWRCPCLLLVVTPSESVARWAARPIDLGQPGSSFVPLVLGPSAIPVVTDPERARRSPELALLSVQAHGHSEAALAVGQAAASAAAGLKRWRAEPHRGIIC